MKRSDGNWRSSSARPAEAQTKESATLRAVATSPRSLSDRVLRLIIIGSSAFAALILTIYLARRAYVHWQPERLARAAQAAADAGDVAEASLLTQRALQIDGNNASATRTMANLAEKIGSPEESIWREQVLRLVPDSGPDRLALVRAALRAGKLAQAEEALAKVAAQDRENVGYQSAAGDLALALNKNQEAETHFTQALARDPDNAELQFSLAFVRLRFLERRAEARATLRQLASREAFRIRALRALLQDDVAIYNWDSALPLAKELAADPEGPAERPTGLSRNIAAARAP